VGLELLHQPRQLWWWRGRRGRRRRRRGSGVSRVS
jgi:hypothetical protein